MGRCRFRGQEVLFRNVSQSVIFSPRLRHRTAVSWQWGHVRCYVYDLTTEPHAPATTQNKPTVSEPGRRSQPIVTSFHQ